MQKALGNEQVRGGARYVRFPDDFGARFLISVDTEEEFDWNGPFQRSGHTNVSVHKLFCFQQFIEKYGVKPVYFVDHAIIEHLDAAAFLKDIAAKDLATVGVHLHPWINPPFEEEINDRNSFAGNLPSKLEEAKIVHLRDNIASKIGVQPVIYRAGRYGIGPNTIEILERNGFRIDSSVRAHFDYSMIDGPDFGNISPQPARVGKNGNLLEIPLTTIFSGMLRQHYKILNPLMNRSNNANALLAKTGMIEKIPLTPEGISVREACQAIDIALDDGLKLLVFSFHSPSLSAGHTPYVKTDDDLNRFYDWWREILDYLNARGVAPVGVDDLIDAIQ